MKIKLSNPYYHIAFWLVVIGILTLVFGRSWGSGINAFFFVIMLLPVVVATSYLFNFYLVPKFLLTKKYGWFALYFFYLLVGSLYLQMWVLVLSYMYLANFRLAEMGPNSTDMLLLAMVLYMVVFMSSFVVLLQQLSVRQKTIEHLSEAQEKRKKAVLEVISKRQLVRIPHNEIIYIESLSDYILVHTQTQGKISSKMKIGAVEQELPDSFVRIHRSFIVNSEKISRVTASEVELDGVQLNIGRTYKKEVMPLLKTSGAGEG